MGTKKSERIVESINLRNDEDIDMWSKFLFLITTTPDFEDIKDESWQEGKIKSMALRHHMEKFVCKNYGRIEADGVLKSDFKDFQKDFYEKLNKRRGDGDVQGRD